MSSKKQVWLECWQGLPSFSFGRVENNVVDEVEVEVESIEINPSSSIEEESRK
jgi:hypothetical protein